MAVERTKRENRTPERILDVAERLVQTRGFNNFSYADIAKELEITTASLHYHFRGKAELGQALITRYAERFGDSLERIDTEVPDARGSSRPTRASTPACSRASGCACAACSPPSTKRCPSRCGAP